jgi:hypothetical protein
LLSVTSAAAQTPAIPRDAATDDQLDPMLAGRDWKGLESILMRPADRATTAKHLNWMNRQVRGGGNFFLAQIYAGRLWMAGQGDSGLRQDASEMLLYALALVQVDGAVCEDRTAPERRLRQVLDWQAPVLRATRALPPARMAQLARAAQALESVTASRRMERDETLCQGGEAALLAGLSFGNATIQVMPMPGQAAGKPAATPRQVVVSPPRGWKPSFLPPQAYEAKQMAIRRDLPRMLLVAVK